VYRRVEPLSPDSVAPLLELISLQPLCDLASVSPRSSVKLSRDKNPQKQKKEIILSLGQQYNVYNIIINILTIKNEILSFLYINIKINHIVGGARVPPSFCRARLGVRDGCHLEVRGGDRQGDARCQAPSLPQRC